MIEILSQQELAALIGDIYDCALDPTLWDATLVKLGEALHTRTVFLGLNELPRVRVIMQKNVGMRPQDHQALADHATELQSILANYLTGRPSIDDPLVMSRFLDAEYWASSPYIQKALLPGGIVDVTQYFLTMTPTRMGGLGLGKDVSRGPASDDELALGAMLLPHIRRAVMISDVLDIKTIERARMAEALDALRCAVILTNAHGKIMHANAPAEAILRDGDGVKSVRGVLHAGVPASTAELHAAIALAAAGDADIGNHGLAIRLTGDNAVPLLAHVLPLTGGAERTRMQPAAVAAVFIGLPEDERDAAEAIATAFGLTSAEKRVLESLVAGHTLAETATRLDVAQATAKTHLSRIFSKTGVNRQADLLRIAARLGVVKRRP